MATDSPRRSADVVVPVYADVERTRECLDSVLDHSGDALERLIIVDDRGPEPTMGTLLEEVRRRDDRVRLLRNEENLGFVRSANRGLSIRRTDAVVLNSDTRVTPGWLEEMLGVAYESDRIAAVVPLSNNATLCSVPDYMRAASAELLEQARLRLSHLPRYTAMPTGVGFCLLMKHAALNLLGLFDPVFGRGYHEENDWCARAQRAGFVIARANRALVFHVGGSSFGAARSELEGKNAHTLVHRHPHYLEQNREFDASPDARIAAHAVARQVRRIRVCADASLPPQLVRALELDGRVEVVASDFGPKEGCEIFHRAGIDDPEQLEAFLRTTSHTVLSLDDATPLRSPASADGFERLIRRRARLWAALSSAGAVIVPSRRDRDELVRELHLSPGVVHSIAPGVDVSGEPPRSERFLLCLGGEDMRALVLPAYALLRAALPNAPELLVDGVRQNEYPPGVRHVGDAGEPYRDALAVVLPGAFAPVHHAVKALEAGKPVIAHATSAAAEWCGDALVPLRSLSVPELASLLRELCENDERRKHLASAARAQAQKLDWTEAARATIDVYLAVVDRPDLRALHQRRWLAHLIGSQPLAAARRRVP